MDMLVPAKPIEIGISELRAFVGLKPSRQDGKEFPSDLRDLFVQLVNQCDKLLLHAVEARSAEEFRSRREGVFETYVKVQGATASLADAIIPKVLMESAVSDAFAGLEAEFKAEALPRFGEDARDQALFTTWTLRRTMGLLERINDLGMPQKEQEEDQEKGKECSIHLWWTFFHLDCFRAAIKYDKPLRSEIVRLLIDGLRAAVNAYALARQGLTLREGKRSVPVTDVPEWDDEDQSLLDESMAELDSTPVPEEDAYQTG